jgi:serine/threonine protein kinase
MPQLKVLTGSQKGQIFLLRPPGPYRLGRDGKAEFPLFDRRASRNHFRVDFSDEGYRVTDLRSKAGTYLNDRKVESALLVPGDRILAGKTLFAFELDAPPDGLVGRELGGYRILERVGRGGMGTVYRALQLSLERIVALKVLTEDFARDRDFSVLFIREARAAGNLSHPNIVRVYDVNSLDSVLFYAMEFMAHGSVEDLLRREGPLPITRALAIALEAARGLEYADGEGIVHRDIKPANLMIHEKGQVKIGDLGIATRSRDKGGSGRARGISGSPHYMSPEQALGRDVDTRADIYALGATLHQMLVGAPPFRGKSLKELLYAHLQEQPPDVRLARPSVPEDLARLVQRMLAKEPAARPQVVELTRELEALLVHDDSLETARLPRPPSKVRRSLGFGILMLLCLVAGIAAGLLLRDLRRAVRGQNVRIQRVRRTIDEGWKALQAGDIEAAVRKAEEISKLQFPTEEYEIIERDITAFTEAVKAAAAHLETERK